MKCCATSSRVQPTAFAYASTAGIPSNSHTSRVCSLIFVGTRCLSSARKLWVLIKSNFTEGFRRAMTAALEYAFPFADTWVETNFWSSPADPPINNTRVRSPMVSMVRSSAPARPSKRIIPTYFWKSRSRMGILKCCSNSSNA